MGTLRRIDVESTLKRRPGRRFNVDQTSIGYRVPTRLEPWSIKKGFLSYFSLYLLVQSDFRLIFLEIKTIHVSFFIRNPFIRN